MDRACNPELLEELLRGRIDSYKPTNIERFETSMSKLSGPMSVLFDDDSEDEGEALTLGDLAAVHDEVVHVQDNRVSGVGTGENNDGFKDDVKARTQGPPASSASTKQEETKNVSARNVSAKKATKSNDTGFNTSDAPRFPPSVACCFPEDGTVRKQDVSAHSRSGKGKEVQRQHDLLGIFADSGNQGVVLQDEYESGSEESYCYESEYEFEADTHRGDEHEATGVDLMNSLFAQVVTRVLPGKGGDHKGKNQPRQSRGRHKRTPSIYILTSPVGKQYVGQTVWPVVRMNKYRNGLNHDQPAITNAINKYGWDNMKLEWVFGGIGKDVVPIAEEALDDVETEMIETLQTKEPNGYNILDGGKTARRRPGLSRTEPRGPRSEEFKQRLRDVWKLKREVSLSDKDPEYARRKTMHAEQSQAKRLEKLNGVDIDHRFGKVPKRSHTWDLKREAKLALLPPEEAARERVRLQKRREKAMENYDRLHRRTPGNFLANS